MIKISNHGLITKPLYLKFLKATQKILVFDKLVKPKTNWFLSQTLRVFKKPKGLSLKNLKITFDWVYQGLLIYLSPSFSEVLEVSGSKYTSLKSLYCIGLLGKFFTRELSKR